jgi:hypothetical protein
MERPMPAPPKPGMFGGKIRIVTGTEEPDVLLAPKKPEDTPAATADLPEPPKVPSVEAPKPVPEAPKAAPPPVQPKPLSPGESVRFDDDQAP